MGLAGLRIELNRAGVRELLRSPEVLAELERRAHKIAAAAGPGMEVGTFTGPNRARASVITATEEAAIAEATEGRLSAAIDAGRT